MLPRGKAPNLGAAHGSHHRTSNRLPSPLSTHPTASRSPLLHQTMPVTTKTEAEALTVAELKTELESRGLPTEGLKVQSPSLFFFMVAGGISREPRYIHRRHTLTTPAACTALLLQYLSLSCVGVHGVGGYKGFVLPRQRGTFGRKNQIMLSARSATALLGGTAEGHHLPPRPHRRCAKVPHVEKEKRQLACSSLPRCLSDV